LVNESLYSFTVLISPAGILQLITTPNCFFCTSRKTYKGALLERFKLTRKIIKKIVLTMQLQIPQIMKVDAQYVMDWKI
jgi:hypothetical protein